MVDLAEYKSLVILIKSFTGIVGIHLTRVDARGNVRKQREAASVSSVEECFQEEQELAGIEARNISVRW